MLEAFLTYINGQNLFEKDQKILLATSGGIDSAVMCDLFSKAKLNFAIAHCNFGLRSEESDADEVFVKKLSIKYKVSFFTTTFETSSYAENNGISIQMAARNLRYTWFEEIRQKNEFDYIATAHHQNDSIETLLLNLAKGTGITGLHGILPKRGRLIRPLLFAKKDQIFEYVVDNQLVWREDSSNESVKYQRNYIRQELVPKFIELNPNFEETIQRTIEKVKAMDELFQYNYQKFKAENLIFKDEVIFLPFGSLLKNSLLKIYFIEIFADFNFNYDQSIQIIESVIGQAGKTFISPTHVLVKDREAFVITSKNILEEFGTKEIELEQLDNQIITFDDLKLKSTIAEYSPTTNLKTNKKTATLDFETLKSPLKIRKWKEGDWFCPLGMNKKKNVSDLLNSEKVPLNIKKNVKVLTSNGSIIWVVGYRIDNRFKITDKTKKMIFIEQI